MSSPEPKTCRVCGRRITWRRRWADRWDAITTCSAGCRKRGIRAADRALETLLLDTLTAEPRGALLCPSEAARQVFDPCGPAELERARSAARRLVARGLAELVQRGRVVDPSTARGPVSLRLV